MLLWQVIEGYIRLPCQASNAVSKLRQFGSPHDSEAVVSELHTG